MNLFFLCGGPHKENSKLEVHNSILVVNENKFAFRCIYNFMFLLFFHLVESGFNCVSNLEARNQFNSLQTNKALVLDLCEKDITYERRDDFIITLS